MLIYHPAFDIYNCIFRILQLFNNIQQREIEVDRLRIWDFYLSFPREASKISFPVALKPLKDLVFKDKEENPYEDLIDAKRIIERMKPYQLSALNSLASYDFIDKEALKQNLVKRTNKEIPNELKEEIMNVTPERSNIIKLVTGFWELPLYGVHGLKARTGLIDFKYDAN